jgi:hypothetical protein
MTLHIADVENTGDETITSTPQTEPNNPEARWTIKSANTNGYIVYS